MKIMSKLATASISGAIVGTLALTGLASAHSNHIRVVMKGDCATGINVEAHDYPRIHGGSASVTVEFDGNVFFQKVFSGNVKDHVPNPDQSVPHLYRVTFDRFNFVGEGDKEYTGVLPACKNAPATTTTIAPTTTSETTTSIATETPPVPATVALVVPPEVPTTSVPPTDTPPSGGLPATGLSAEQRLGLAMVVFGCGWALVRLARRPRTS
jgi:hypothetical protein